MQLPTKFKWLENIGTLPKIVSAAIQLLGVKEIQGKADNPIIMNMAETIGLKGIYNNDEMSWCAIFINYLLKIIGKPMVDYKGDIYNLMRAKWLLNWGEKVDFKDIKLGDICIIDRVGGGHVFVFIAKTPKGNLVGIGGNQSNSVSFSEFDATRLLGVRRFYATKIPDSAALYVVQSNGKLSTNEA